MTSQSKAIIPYSEGMDIIFLDYEPYLTQAQIAELFKTSVPNVARIIQYAIKKEAVEPESMITLSVTMGNRNYDVIHYNLDVVLMVGYRLKDITPRVAAFRKWVGQVLRQHIMYQAQQIEALENETAMIDHERRGWRQVANEIARDFPVD